MPSNEIYNERELFHRIAGGEHSAFTEMVNLYWNRLYSQAIVYVKDSYKAQDIVQDVFLNVWINRERLMGIDKPGSYLFIITKNKIISEFRKKVEMPIADSHENIIFDHTLQPDEKLSHKRLMELVHDAIGQMPPQRKQVFVLSRNEEMTYEEIAAQLGISRETVKGHMIKALAFIRTFLRHNWEILMSILFFRYFF